MFEGDLNTADNISIIVKEIRRRCPVVNRALETTGDLTLNQYAQSIKIKSAAPLQDKRDFLMLAEEYCEPLLGRAAAKEISAALEFPLLATANHHGVDFSPQTMQGNWIYWKMLQGKGINREYLPICSFGMVSLRNSSYARGLMLHTMGAGRIRIPIFPKIMENKMVCFTPAFDAHDVERARNTVEKQYHSLSSSEVTLQILDEVFLDRGILACHRYGDQAVLLNQRLAQKSFRKGEFPELIYIETERITNKLILLDLENTNSLLHLLLCHKKVLALLNETLYGGMPLSQLAFWGVDGEGRRYPIRLTEDGQFIGKTMKNEEVRMSAHKEDLIRLVQDEKIVPAGYTIAAMLCWARGYTWMGGCFQGDYLPVWQSLTAQCLEKAGYEEESRSIMQYDCTGYVCGPIFALAKTDDGMLNPAGFAELIKAGGLSLKQMNRLMEATMRESHEMGLLEFYGDLVPTAERQSEWSAAIAGGLKEKYENYAIEI